MKIFFTALVLMVLMPLSLHATYGAQFTVVDGDAEKAYNSFVEKELPKLGWILSDPHARINDGYSTKFGSTKLDNLGFFSISNDLIMRDLLLLAPELGGFSPFNFHIYKKKNENKTYIGFIKSKTMLDIVGIDDKKVT
ncbi:MAG: hypothetical protein OEW60_08805, partial [Thiovulaceae bacterium]|nr:hypothetical protein [Sulfurimonadaceae bacterium]